MHVGRRCTTLGERRDNKTVLYNIRHGQLYYESHHLICSYLAEKAVMKMNVMLMASRPFLLCQSLCLTERFIQLNMRVGGKVN